MDKIEIKLYRHKTYKDIYLVRNWVLSGGGPDSNWFRATEDLKEAIESTLKGDVEREYRGIYYNSSTKHSELKAKIVLEKEMEFDGYKGKMRKELVLPLDDFELITLKEE